MQPPLVGQSLILEINLRFTQNEGLTLSIGISDILFF